MTNDRFRDLCEQMLLPRLGDFMNRQLADVQDELEIIARELVRVGDTLDRVITHLGKRDGHAGQR